MADQDLNLAAVLAIPAGMEQDLRNVDDILASMERHVTQMAAGFTTIKTGFDTVLNKASQFKQNITATFDEKGVIRSFKAVSDAVEKMNQMGASGKSGFATNEDRLNIQLEKIWKKRADTYESIQQRIEQLQDYMAKVDHLELSKKAAGGQLDQKTIDNYVKASQYIDELRDRVQLLNLGFDKLRAGSDVQRAIGLDEHTVDQAKEKLKALIEARKQVLLPGGADDAATQNTWLTALEQEIARVSAKMKQLEADEERLKNQNKAGQAFGSLNEGYNTDYSSGSFEERINKAKEALQHFQDAYRQMLSQKKAGNPFITDAHVEEARRNIEKVKQDLESLQGRKKQYNKYKNATNILDVADSLDEDKVESLKTKLKQYEKALLRLKTLQAEGNIYVNQDDINRANKGIEDTTKNIERLEDELKYTKNQFKEMSSSAQSLSSSIKSALSITGVTKFVKEVVRVRSEFSMIERSLAVLVQNEAEATKIFSQVQEIAFHSPYEIKDIAAQVKQIAAYGVETDKLIEKTKMLGDIASGTGVELNRLALAYGQIRAATVLKGQEARQLTEAGVDIFNALAQYYTEMYQRGVSAAEVMDMMRRKMISFEDVDAVLQRMTSVGGKFYKMQEKQAETVGGMISNLKDRASSLFNSIGSDTEGLIKLIVKAIQGILSFKGTIETVFAVGGSFIFFNGLSQALLHLARQTWDVSNGIWKVITGVKKLKDATEKINFAGNMLGMLAAVAALVYTIWRNANKLKDELKKIREETEATADEQTRTYKDMIEALNDETATIAEKQRTLEKLKSTYGETLPLERYSLDNVEELTSKTEAYIKVLRTRIEEEGRQRQVQAALESNDYEKTKRSVVKTVKRVMGGVDDPSLKNIFSESEIISAFEYQFDKMVESGDEVELTLDKIIEKMVKYKGLTEEQSDALQQSLQAYKYRHVAIEEGNNGIAKIKNNLEKVLHPKKDWEIKMESTFDMDNIEKEFPKIKKAFDDAMKARGRKVGEDGVISQAITENTAAITNDAREKAREAYDGIIKEIKEAGEKMDPTVAADFIKSASDMAEAYFENVIGDSFTRALDEVIADINSRHVGDDLNFDLGKTWDTGKVGNESPEEYTEKIGKNIKKYQKHLDDLKAISNGTKEFSELEVEKIMTEIGLSKAMYLLIESYAGSDMSADNMLNAWSLALDEMTPQIEARLEQMKEFYKSLGGILGNSKNNGGRSIKDELNDLIRALREAAKEWEHLDQTGKNVLSEQIKIKAGRLKITTPEQFDTSSLMDLVNKLLADPRMKRDDVLSITLDINKDQLKESFDDIKEKIEGLWKDYDMAKQMKDFGIVFEGFSMEDVMTKLSEEEAKLRKKGNDENLAEATKAADEIAQKRLDILRKEREEALKLMHDSEKKAQDKAIQIYQDAYEKIGKIISGANKGAKEGQMVSEEEIQKSVNAVLAKSYEDVAKAQWDAYKSTDMYIAAFGDLETTSSEVLTAIYNQLERFAKMQGLNPADAKAIAQAKAKIEEQMYLRPGEGVNNYWKLMKEDMDRYYEARKDYNDNIDAYRAEYVTATDDYEKARQASELADKEYAEALAGQNQAQNLKDKADAAVRDAQEKLNTQQEIVAQATRDVDNATAGVSLKTGTKAEKQARQDALTAAKKTLADAQEEEVRLQKELDAANKNVADTDNALIAATNEVSKKYGEQTEKANAVRAAQDKMNETGKKVIDTEKRKKLALNATKTHLDKLISAYDAVANEVTGSINLARDFAEAMGLALGDDANEAIDAFTSSFGMMSQALSLASGAMAIFTAMEEAATAAGMTLQTVLWPLLIITAVIGAISAIIKAADNAKVKQIEQHKETVDNLKKSFDDLKDSFEEVMSMKAAADNFDKQLRNLQQQREELEQIIALEESRGVKRDEEALKGYIDDLHDLDKAEKDANKSKLDLLNVPSNYQDVAKDWSSSWLDAFKDTGKGLKSLKESFDSLYEDMVVGQLQFKVMGPALEKIQKMMTDAAEDMDITPSEAASIRKEWEESRAYVNKMMTEWARAYGIAVSDSLATDTLQRGIQSLTEDTGQVIESYLNSIRFIVSDSNLTHKEVLDILRGTGGMENPMLSELKAQTEVARRIEDAILSVTRSGHTKGGNGLKVFLD